MTSEPRGIEQRRFFRLRYPGDSNARIVINAQSYNLTEISEEGIRFGCDSSRFTIGEDVAGQIIIHTGYLGEVSGVVLRYDESAQEIIVRLIQKRIPQQIVFEEQRLLLQHTQRRQHTRLEYPTGKHADLQIHSQGYEVIQISEEGLCFRNGQSSFLPGERVSGRIALLSGYREPVEGIVQRIDSEHNLTVLHLTARGIPVQAVSNELQYLLHHGSVTP